ncbi:MAG: dihydropteroate synthase [Bacteroidales bacterium]|nr:dihydropteroate synthase [Bacteroidales bacterium]HRX30556.1 dihydropteroate synthase [Tenuifilaceae bacterium]
MEPLPSFIKTRKTLASNGKLINIEKPLIMGIINVTHNSFFAQSRCKTKHGITHRAGKMLTQGAAIIDVGACSTRPGVEMVSEEKELKRLNMAIGSIRKKFPDAVISIDTFRSGVARRMVKDFAVDIINDISAGDLDSKMFETIADLKVPYIIMHMQGTPQNMQQNPTYNNVVQDILLYLNEKVEKLKTLGVNDIIIDPGLGFGKTINHNYTLLKNLDAFKLFELPILIGLSRKSMIFKTLNTTPKGSLNGTSILNTIALLNGANILRVHDVQEAVECVKLVDIYKNQPEFQYL